MNRWQRQALERARFTRSLRRRKPQIEVLRERIEFEAEREDRRRENAQAVAAIMNRFSCAEWLARDALGQAIVASRR